MSSTFVCVCHKDKGWAKKTAPAKMWRASACWVMSQSTSASPPLPRRLSLASSFFSTLSDCLWMLHGSQTRFDSISKSRVSLEGNVELSREAAHFLEGGRGII